MSAHADFYDAAYASADARQREWRALGARGKADHVVELLARAGVSPGTLLEVGCGDGALLAELGRRGVAGALDGVEISSAALAVAREHEIPRLRSLERFDGARLDGRWDLVVLSHVLEHAADPRALLSEAGRVGERVLVEVPLEANLSGRRASKRAGSERIGHIRALDRRATRRLVADAGLAVEAELLDPLPAAVHAFFATGAAARVRAYARATVRHVLFGASPRAAERLLTLHYACLCRAAPGR